MNFIQVFDLISPFIIPAVMVLTIIGTRQIVDHEPEQIADYLSSRRFYQRLLKLAIGLAIILTGAKVGISESSFISRLGFIVGLVLALVVNRYYIAELESLLPSTPKT